MVRPAAFGFNVETALDNAFQEAKALEGLSPQGILIRAQSEFDTLVAKLRAAGVQVSVAEDSPEPVKPDAVFPNNWLAFDTEGRAFFFPMKAENRRRERRREVLKALTSGSEDIEVFDLSYFEAEGKFLEGTGSMIPDRRNKVIYACLSERTHPEVLSTFAGQVGYEIHAFHAFGPEGKAVYHTNVMMCLGEKLAVVCLEALSDQEEREKLRASLLGSNREVIEISTGQMGEFAGNMLELWLSQGGNEGQKPERGILVMSSRAFRSLSPYQIRQIESFDTILHSELGVIEVNGGSARCMIAEARFQKC